MNCRRFQQTASEGYGNKTHEAISPRDESRPAFVP